MPKKLINPLAIFLLCFNQLFCTALAEPLPINIDGTTGTSVSRTASLIDQINIATPNSSGVSHNNFTDYNINQAGQIINNFSGNNPSEILAGSGANAVTTTEIGGLVTVNQNLISSGSARIILNEVTSTHETNLNGYAEIAGTKAELIIANPNGITCSGCGFINTSRLSLIAGASNNGNLEFNLKERDSANLTIPLLTINGLGLDATTTSATDIIASSIKLIANIYGAETTEVTLKSAFGNYDYNSKELTDSGANLNSNSEIFAIDASNLGVIQAGRIFIIATKDGLGVKLAGNILATQELNIDAAGNLYYQNILAGNSASIKSLRNISSLNSTAEISAPNLNISSATTFTNHGNITAYNLNIFDGDVIDNLGIIQSLNLDISNIKNITNSKIIYGESFLAISGENLANSASANIFSDVVYAIILTGLLSNSGVISSKEDLNISANQLLNSGEISAENNLIIFATNANNSGNLISNAALTISGESLNNHGQIQALDDVNFNLTSLHNLEDAEIFSEKDLNIYSAFLNNFGTVSSADELQISVSTALINSAIILASNKINISAKDFTNDGAALISSLKSSLTLTLSGDSQNYGELNSAKNLSIKSANFSNNGNILAAKSLIFTVDSLDNSGLIYSGDNLTLNAVNLDNSSYGKIFSAENLDLILSVALKNSGRIVGDKNLILSADSLNNSGEISALRNLSIEIHDDFTNSNKILSKAILNIGANNLNNSDQAAIASLDNSLTLSLRGNLQNYGEVNSAKNLTITGDNFTNSGNILSSELLTLTNNSLSNYGNIQSAKDLTLNSQSLDNSGLIKAFAKIYINSDSLLNHSAAVILSSDDFALTLTNSLSNSGNISSVANLILRSDEVVNFGEIFSGANLNITAASLSNSNQIQSKEGIALNLQSLINSPWALILAQNNFTITASSITNSNTKPSNNFITAGLVSVDGIITLRVDRLNNISGIIAAQSTSLNPLHNSSVTLANDSGKFISTASVLLNLGSLDYSITGEIAASRIDIIANNITNLGNVTASNYIKLSGSTITNGRSGIDNRNVILASGSYIDLSATNSINNYGTFLANSALTLTAGAAINNYGSIMAGEGGAIINSGSFNNAFSSSKITSENNLIFNLGSDLNNYGEISVKNNLSVNAANSFYNYQNALLWSGGDASFELVNSFVNSQAEIYAERNLLIAAGNNKINSFRNLSGKIETFSGDILIKASSFYNGRNDSSITLEPLWDEAYHVCDISDSICQSGEYRLPVGVTLANHDLFDWVFVGSNSTNYAYAAKRLENHDLKTIYSGKDFTLESASFTNEVANIFSAGDMNIAFESSFSNSSKTYFGMLFSDSYNAQACAGLMGSCFKYWKYYENIDFNSSFNPYIKSSGALTISQSGSSKAEFINGDSIVRGADLSNNSRQLQNTNFNKVDNYNSERGILNIDLTAILAALSGDILESSNGTISPIVPIDPTAPNLTAPSLNPSHPDSVFSGSFKINLKNNPNQPLVEARSEFTDVSKFFGSNYYFTQLGLDGNAIIKDINRQAQQESSHVRILGDAYVEDRLILDQIRILTNGKSSVDQVKKLLDNSFAEFTRLGLSATDIALHGLSAEQINSLTKDIVTFEKITLGGISILAPRIYLTLESRNNFAANSTSGPRIFAQDSLTINSPSASLFNSGSISSGGNVTFNLASLTNRFGAISSASDLTISTIGDIKNIGANIFALNNLTLASTAGKILNSSVIQTNDKNLLDSNSDSYQLAQGQSATTSGNIRSSLLQNSTITGTDITINAATNFTNLAAKITASGNIAVTAGDDINIGVLALRNRSESVWGNKKKGGSLISDVMANLQSEVESAGDISLISTGANINIIGSKLTSGENLTIAAHDDINISAAQNSSYAESTFYKKGSVVTKSALDIRAAVTNINSELNAGGDVNISSGSDTNLIGAKLTAANATIIAGDELNIYSVADTNYSYSTSSSSRNFSSITKFVMPGFAEVSGVIADIGLPIIGNVALNVQATLNGDFSSKSNLNERDKLTNQASNINVSGDLNLTSNNNLNIVGSNLNGGLGNVQSTAGEVNIFNAVDYDYSRSESNKSQTTFSSVASGMVQATLAGASTFFAHTNSLKTSQEKKDIAEENNQASENTPKETEQNIDITRNETIIASNLNFNNLAINSAQNLNITSSNLTITNSANLSSAADTNITTALENDYSYSFHEKKTPSIAAAFSNGIVKIFNEAMPSFGRGDNAESNDQIKELVYDRDKNKTEITTQTNSASNLNIGGNLNIFSQENNLISGSNLAANNINLTSNSGATIITSALDKLNKSTSNITQDYNNLSLNYNRGRVSANANFSVSEAETTLQTTTQKQSNLLAANNLTINSNQELNILSSNLEATNGTTTLNSNEGNVNILDRKNTTSTTTQIKTGDLTLSVGIGNSHIDTAYAEYDVIEATRNLADAKKELNHMETLRNNGQVDDAAVSDAKINLTIATLNLALAEMKLAAAAAKSAVSCGNSLCTGLYGDLRLAIDGTKFNSNIISVTSVASNIASGENIIINSGLNLIPSSSEIISGTKGNTTITGSNISSQNGNIEITSQNNSIIQASKDNYNQATTTKSWNQNLTLASSAGSEAAIDNTINNLQISLGLGMSRSKSDTSSTTYNNSSITANSGNITLTSINNTDITGANILAQNTFLNVGNNLKIESKQNSYTEKGSSFGLNLGGGGGANGSSSVNFGINYSSNKTDRLWTDNQTSVIGTNSVEINTINNTNLIGAIIANITNFTPSSSLAFGRGSQNLIDGRNLILNTNSLTFKNLNDHYYTSQFAAGISTSIGAGLNSNESNPIQNLNFYPSGSTSLNLQNSSYRKEGITQATIGEGSINITQNSDIQNLNRDIAKSQIITRDQITGALEVGVTIDNRLFTSSGRNQMMSEQQNLGGNLVASNSAIASDIKESAVAIGEVTQNLYNEIGVLLTPEQKAEVDQAMIGGNAQRVFDLIEERGIELTESAKEKVRQFVDKEVEGNKFLASLTDEERNVLVQPKSIGLFFDGTNNNGPRDEKNGEESNVWRLSNVYVGKDLYITGVGSSDEFADTFDQATGYGASSKEQKGMKDFAEVYQKMVDDGNNQPFVITDLVGFSRGAATERNFANILLNQGANSESGSIMPEQVILRLSVPFDTVSSFGAPWNGIDIGKNFSTNLDTYVIHPTAEDEVRTNFALQSIKPAPDAVLPSNWIEQSFPGVHSDIGGSYANGFQGKSNEIALYTLNWVVNQANNLTGQKIFNTPPTNQQPSAYLSVVMDSYLQAKQNNDRTTSEAAKSILQDKYIHDNVIQYNPAHWSFGDRNIFYPNSQLKSDVKKDVSINQSN